MSNVDRETLAQFFQERQDEAAASQPGQQASPVLELIVEHLPEYPATVFSRFGEVLLQTRPAIALFGDYTRTGGSSHFLVDRWLTDPSARERYLVEVGVPSGTARGVIGMSRWAGWRCTATCWSVRWSARCCWSSWLSPAPPATRSCVLWPPGVTRRALPAGGNPG